MAPVTRWVRPVARARATMVFCVPFLASDGHGKPTHEPQAMHASRPSRGTLLMASGTRVVAIPRALAPRRSVSAAIDSGSGGIG